MPSPPSFVSLLIHEKVAWVDQWVHHFQDGRGLNAQMAEMLTAREKPAIHLHKDGRVKKAIQFTIDWFQK
jgi:hypothetical protein